MLVLLRLPPEILYLYNGAAGARQIRDLVFRLMWDPGGEVLTEQEMIALLQFLGRSPSPLAGAQIVEFFNALDTLTPRRLNLLFRKLFDEAAAIPRAQRWQDLRPWFQAPNPMTADQFETMVNHLRAPHIAQELLLTRADMYAVFEEIRPCEGATANNLFVLLCHPTVEHGMTGHKFKRSILWMRDAPAHTNAMTLTQILALVTDLRTNPVAVAGDRINGRQIYEMIEAARNSVRTTSINPSEFRRMIVGLRTPVRTHLHPRHLHDLISEGGAPGQGPAPILTRWLFEAVTAAGVPSFAQRLDECAPLALTFPGLRAILARISRFFPSHWGVRLLEVFAALNVGTHRQTRLENFLTELLTAANGNAGRTMTDIIRHLSRFLTAGRAPHGANNRKYANTGQYGGGEAASVLGQIARANPDNQAPTSLGKVVLSHFRLNYFCNSHTYAHCNFTQRLGVHGVQDFEFWAPAGNARGAVITAFQANSVAAYTRRVGREHAPAGEETVVVTDSDWQATTHYFLYYLVHFSPATTVNIHRTILTALQHLFDEV
ncbi:MAG TPA: hypothetical protein VK968_02610, partial [Roseimicrobium sp.]|nr:hypothetical protein [Roseimicrobium sp.]